MSGSKFGLLIGAFISYIIVLICFLTHQYDFALLFFVLHSILLLSFCYFFSLSSDLSKQLKQLKEENGEILAKQEEYLSQISMVSKQKEELKQSMEQLLSEKDAQISQAKADLSEEKSRLANALSRELLPPLPENASDEETCNLTLIIEEVVKEFQADVDENSLQIQINAPSSPLIFRGAVSRLRILFHNIIDNSVKYMDRSGTLVITLSDCDKDCFIVLKDNGDGLSSSELEHIFDLNYQGSNRKYGNGLGLTQAKTIVDHYHGNIYARSTPGNGMGIYVLLPSLE